MALFSSSLCMRHEAWSMWGRIGSWDLDLVQNLNNLFYIQSWSGKTWNLNAKSIFRGRFQVQSPIRVSWMILSWALIDILVLGSILHIIFSILSKGFGFCKLEFESPEMELTINQSLWSLQNPPTQCLPIVSLYTSRKYGLFIHCLFIINKKSKKVP
jgi:hypothetical protein